MLTFHPLSLGDKEKIDRFVYAENSRSADFNFGNMFLWDDTYKQMVADSDRHLITMCCNGAHPVFPFPIACEDLTGAVNEMREYAQANGFPLVICGVEEQHKSLLEQAFPGCFAFENEREYADYIYDIERLISLRGKKLHGKRNHVSRFEREHPDWHFDALQPEHRGDCMALFDAWAESAEDADGSIAGERKAIELAFDYYDLLGLLGGALFTDGKLVGFSIGEKCCADTVNVHFEKARADIEGCYPMVNREFVKLVRQRWPEINYVNREDDMGLDSLRKSKLSYHPDILLEKYEAVWRATR